MNYILFPRLVYVESVPMKTEPPNLLDKPCKEVFNALSNDKSPEEKIKILLRVIEYIKTIKPVYQKV